MQNKKNAPEGSTEARREQHPYTCLLAGLLLVIAGVAMITVPDPITTPTIVTSIGMLLVVGIAPPLIVHGLHVIDERSEGGMQ